MSAIKAEYDSRPMPSIKGLQVRDDARLEVTWNRGGRAGRTEIVDLSPVINKYRVYAPIRRKEAFAKVRLEDDGETLVWGDDIDMSATLVEDAAQDQMTGSDFQLFLERNCLTRQEAAAELGRSLRAIQDYVVCTEPLPRLVMLACKGYEARKNPYACSWDITLNKAFIANTTYFFAPILVASAPAANDSDPEPKPWVKHVG